MHYYGMGFNSLTVDGTKAQVNYDNINFVSPAGDGSLITFRDGMTLLVKEQINLEWPMSNDALFIPADSAAQSAQSEHETISLVPPSAD